jgi:cob(I)alamin adenosyltransferase
MRITKVYTRTGDAGKTRLAGGQQVWKDSLRVEAYGTLDELNAVVGVVRVMNAEMAGSHVQAEQLEADLRWIQNKLFDLGGILATAPGQEFKNMPQVTEKDVTKLEKVIDRCQKDLAPLKEFILPGGGKVSGFLHQARTVCRRAERVCVHLSHKEPVDAVNIKFVNRLSDALFVLARWAAKTQGEPEFLWERDVKKAAG